MWAVRRRMALAIPLLIFAPASAHSAIVEGATALVVINELESSVNSIIDRAQQAGDLLIWRVGTSS